MRVGLITDRGRPSGRAIALAAAAALCALPGTVSADRCATPSAAGAATPSGTINTYYPATAGAAAGATSITLGPARGAGSAIAAGDLLLVIQMQDARINTTNGAAYGNGSTTDTFGAGYTNADQSGLFEYVRAASAVGTGGGTVTVSSEGGTGLVNAYSNAAATDTRGQRRFQVIKVPQYSNATVSGTVTAAAWDGTSGGVAALDVAGRLTFSSGTISAAAAGFRGGGGRQLGGGSGTSSDYATLATVTANGAKGEGIAGTPRYVWTGSTVSDTGVEGYPGGSHARGAPGNAGGGGTDGNPSTNDQNTGGGGGGNAGAGGLGGHAWCPTAPTGCPQTGGHPGSAFAERGVARLIMGGGGGSGTTNNGTDAPANSSGALGGGIVMIRAGEIAGMGSINVNGGSASSAVGNDANGGGGAGGSVMLAAARSVTGASLSVSATGGNGGSNDTNDTLAHGPGGGGGGGIVLATSTVTFTAATGGGAPGTTIGGGSFGASYGAAAGASGGTGAITASAIRGVSSGGECTPTVTKSFSPAAIVEGGASTVAISVRNNNPDLALTGVNFIDAYPVNLINFTPAGASKSCAPGTVTAANGGTSLAAAGGSIAAASVCSWSATVTSNVAGTFTNSLSAGDVKGSYAGGATDTTTNLDAATATLTISPGLTIVKTGTALDDPVNGTVNPKHIPGGRVLYRITIANPAASGLTSTDVFALDATPAGLALGVVDLGASGSGPVSFTAGSSGLSYSWGGASSTTDSVDFSSDGGSTWTYTPVPGADGSDPAVTHIRVRPGGSLAPGRSFYFELAYRLL